MTDRMSDTVATTPEDGQEVLALHCEQIDLTLKQCQSNALARNSAAIIESLQSLYSLLMEVKSMEKLENNLRGKVDKYLRDVARELIRTNRVVMSIDDEIDGVVRETLYEDFGWYYEVSDLIAQGCAECDEHSNYMSNISESYGTERWIDKWIGSPFRPRGDLPEEVFKSEMAKQGLKSRDIDSAKEIVNKIKNHIDLMFG